ncbi:Piso0_001596 [Millerozyma farinosa CBS 7064]|uniref:Piso0_001596 protein n=1 Tax=Pichia sorbitophila (strain ATCC MYA-4447 / BCRC 22081 / CBS 7064 / NBRC 10061 / NRRL Y-12695) TaxID=559304 RepID=G8YL77_PICSO|nr:Piso0_001596 [Millerozyma farinosa CBS 7064]
MEHNAKRRKHSPIMDYSGSPVSHVASDDVVYENTNTGHLSSHETPSILEESTYTSYNMTETKLQNFDPTTNPYIEVQNRSNNEIIVDILLANSDFYLRKAHQTVPYSNTPQGVSTYQTFIKLSIKSLLILIRRYDKALNPYLESVIYLKLASIYFDETDNLNRADDYSNKAIAITTRNNFSSLKFAAEVLAAKVLERSRPGLALNYLSEKIQSYNSSGLICLGNLLSILKTVILLQEDYIAGLVALQSLSSLEVVDPATKAFYLLVQANLHLTDASPAIAISLCNEASTLFEYLQSYPQLMAMCLLHKLCGHIQDSDLKQGKEMINKISDFVQNQQNNGWKWWKEDGVINIAVGITSDETYSVRYGIPWINSDEFVILFYMLTGVLLLRTRNKKKKAKQIFEKCLEMVSNKLNEVRQCSQHRHTMVTSSRWHYHEKIVFLDIVRYKINFYATFMDFLEGKFSSPSNELRNVYYDLRFASTDVINYSIQNTELHYTYALFFQYNGGISRAKYHFLKILTDVLNKKSSSKATLFSSERAIKSEIENRKWLHSEIYAFALINLKSIIDYEVYRIPEETKKVGSFSLNRLLELKNVIDNDLNSIVMNNNSNPSNKFLSNFTSSYFSGTYHILNQIQAYQQNDSIISLDNRILLGMDLKDYLPRVDEFVPSFLSALVKFTMYITSKTLEEKMKWLEQALAEVQINSASHNSLITHTFILSEYYNLLIMRNELDKASFTKTQLDIVKKKIEYKFTT